MMAEGGALTGLQAESGSIGAIMATANTSPLAPGATVSVTTFDTGSNTELTLAGMILPSNDGFAGLDAWTIPTTAGTYTIMINAYDAGTEANDELLTPMSGAPGVLGIPAAPGMDSGTGGTGVTLEETNQTVHIHRGVIGDTSDLDGASDLDSRIHRWLNPVAKVVVTVQ